MELHEAYLRADGFYALMSLSQQATINYHPASRGFISSEVLAIKRHESHRINVLSGNCIELYEVGVDKGEVLSD